MIIDMIYDNTEKLANMYGKVRTLCGESQKYVYMILTDNVRNEENKVKENEIALILRISKKIIKSCEEVKEILKNEYGVKIIED